MTITNRSIESVTHTVSLDGKKEEIDLDDELPLTVDQLIKELKALSKKGHGKRIITLNCQEYAFEKNIEKDSELIETHYGSTIDIECALA